MHRYAGSRLNGATVQEGSVCYAGLEAVLGKPAMWNLRGGDGSIGILRIPVRAIAPLDRKLSAGGADSGASTVLRSLGLLDVLSSMLAEFSVARLGPTPDCTDSR